MGDEARCTVRWAGRSSAGKALLETNDLIFRGDFRLAIPRASVTALAASNGTLRVTFPDTAGESVAEFDLGPAAEKWAEKIRNPRSLLDKLGVKPGSRVAVVGVKDESFLTQLAARTDDISGPRPNKESDLIFFAAESPSDLDRLTALRGALKPNGAIWVVHTKGKGATLRDVDVFAAAKRAGLVDNKVASFSDTHTAEKLVIPVAERAARRG